MSSLSLAPLRLQRNEEHVCLQQKAFKECLKKEQPRGYIKILNRDGKPVSSVMLDRTTKAIEIKHNGRIFYLRAATTVEFEQWLAVFQSLKLDVELHDMEQQPSSAMMPYGTTEWTLKGDISESPSPIKTPSKAIDDEMEDPVIGNAKNSAIDYDEEDARLLNESKRLEQLLNEDRDKILSSFAQIRKSIKTEQ